MAAKTFSLSVALEPAAARALKAYVRSSGMLQKVVLRKIGEWFVDQPESMQKLILLSETLRNDAELAKKFLQQLVDSTEGRG